MLNLDLMKAAGGSFKILCLGAHADDIEIGCGGTILKLLQSHNNVTFHWVVFSSNPQRADEARASANAVLDGAAQKKIIVASFRESFFPYIGSEIKEVFEQLRQEFSPDLVFTHHRNDLHQDHRLVGELTWNTFRNHLILEYEIPKYDGDLGSPNVFVHLDESVVRRKVDSLMTNFRSQKEKQWFDEKTFLATLRIRGLESNSPSKFAEAFYSRKMILTGSL